MLEYLGGVFELNDGDIKEAMKKLWCICLTYVRNVLKTQK